MSRTEGVSQVRGLLKTTFFLDAFPGACGRQFRRDVVYFVVGDGILLVIDNLDKYFVPGGNGLLKGILGKDSGAEEPQGNGQEGFQ